VGQDWGATVEGSGGGRDRRLAVESTLKGREEVRSVNLDGLQIQASVKEILAAAQQALAAGQLGHVAVAVDEKGVATLTGRALQEGELDKAGEIVSGVGGITRVENRIGTPFSVLEQDANAALAAAGFGGVRAYVRSAEDIGVAGTLTAESDRVKAVAVVVQALVTDHETIDPAVIRDDMTVSEPVVAVASTALPPETTEPVVESTTQSPEPAAPASPLVGTWAGTLRWGISGSSVSISLNSDSVGSVVGRSDYYGSHRYCAGELTLVNASPPKYVFEEKIVEKNPQATCPGGGKFKMVLSGPVTASVEVKRALSRYTGTVQKR